MELKDCFDTSKMMLCPYDREEFGIVFPADVSKTLIISQYRNSSIRDFFVKNRSGAKTDNIFLKMVGDFVDGYEKTVKICCQCYSSRVVYRKFHMVGSLLPNFYYEYFTEYGTYLSKMREELKSYSEFLDNLEVKIHEWAKSKNINDMKSEKDLNASKLKIPQQEETSSCLVF